METLTKSLSGTNCKVILHWYSGDLANLKKAANQGFFFSINHKMVSSTKGRNIISNIPLQNILTETDAPFTYGSEITNRIQSLEKSVNGLSEIYQRDFDEMKQIIFENFRRVLS